MENNSSKKITKDELKKYIISEAMKMLNDGDALEVEMNTMDKEVGSDGKEASALVKTKEKGGFEKKSEAPDAAENIDTEEEAMEVDMNQNDKEGGSDEKVAAAVSVEAASSTKKGESIEGMHNANFESKEANPSTDASKPFEEKKEKVEMNSMDKDGEEGAKTFVAAGSDMSKGHSKGQAKANWSEEAKNEKEKAEAIAKAIQLPESFKNKKELMSFINEHAKKLSNVLIESEKKLTESVSIDSLFNNGKPTDLIVVPNRSMRDEDDLNGYAMRPVKIEGDTVYFKGIGKYNTGEELKFFLDFSTKSEVADIMSYDDKKKEMVWLK